MSSFFTFKDKDMENREMGTYPILHISTFSLQRVDGGAEAEDGLLHVVLDVRNIMGDHLK